MNTLGYNCEIAYNIALCNYKLKQLAPALKHIAEIIEKGVREHPELGTLYQITYFFFNINFYEKVLDPMQKV